MKRFHVHLHVRDIEESVKFYTTFFGMQPTKRKSDYAKWMLDDPRINFAISTQRQPAGVNHLGIQVDTGTELAGMQAQLRAADERMVSERDQACCYARSDKYWVTDPAGIAWETFHTLGNIPVYGEDTAVFGHGTSTTPLSAGCCAPAQRDGSSATSSACCA